MKRIDLKNNKIVIEMNKTEWQQMNAVFYMIDRQPDNYIVDWDVNADPENPKNMTEEKFHVLWGEWKALTQDDSSISSTEIKCVQMKNDALITDMSGDKWHEISDLIGILARLDDDYDIEWETTPNKPNGLTSDEFDLLWDKWLNLTRDDTPRYNVEDDMNHDN